MNWESIYGKERVRGFWPEFGGIARSFPLKILLLRSRRMLDLLHLPFSKEGACGISCANQVPHSGV